MLQQYGSVMIVEHKGVLWATDTHWMIPTEHLTDLAAVLAWWNLAVEPGRYYIDSRVWRDEKLPVSKLPGIGPILAMRPKATEKVGPQTHGGYPLLIDNTFGLAVIFGATTPLVVNRQYLELIQGHPVTRDSYVHREPGSVTSPVWAERGRSPSYSVTIVPLVPSAPWHGWAWR
jgi:hypothetical protein